MLLLSIPDILAIDNFALVNSDTFPNRPPANPGGETSWVRWWVGWVKHSVIPKRVNTSAPCSGQTMRHRKQDLEPRAQPVTPDSVPQGEPITKFP